jgi:hypothetical protein
MDKQTCSLFGDIINNEKIIAKHINKKDKEVARQIINLRTGCTILSIACIALCFGMLFW